MASTWDAKSSEFCEKSKPFPKGHAFFEFDVKKNSKRLKKQQNGDEAFYYLALYSFIEGYFRKHLNDIYTFDGSRTCLHEILEDLINLFSNGKDEDSIKKLKEGFFIIEKSIETRNEITQYKVQIEDLFENKKEISIDLINSILENLKILQDFGTISFQMEKNDIGKSYKKLYISTDRIRHTFSNQLKENLKTSIIQFCIFAENFGFLNEEIESLKHNEEIFGDEIERKKPNDDSDVIKLLEENKKLEKQLKIIMEKYSKSESSNQDFQKKIEELSTRLKKDNDVFEDVAITEDFKEYIAKKEQLKLNQHMLSHYSKSWRNYQVVMSILTKEQEKILNNILSAINKNKKKNYLIQGGPGTGKTVLLINILQAIAKKDVKLLTYTNSLNKYNKYIAKSLIFKNNENSIDPSAKIDTFDGYIQKQAEKILKKEVFLPLAKNEYSDVHSDEIKTLIRTNIDSKKASFIYSEALNEIWGLAPKKQDYIDHSYSYGKENAIQDSLEIKERTKTWEAVKKLEALLNAPTQKAIPLEYACYLLSLSSEIRNEDKKKYGLLDGIKDEYKIDYLLIDEVQDLSNAKIRTIANITRKNYVLTGDLAQSVFIRKGLTWNEVVDLIDDERAKNISTEKKNTVFKSLTKNFRSTFAIQDLANNFRKSENFIIKDENIASEGFMPGPTPDYNILSSLDATIDAIKKRIKILKEELFFSDKDFCIVVPSKVEIQTILKSFEKDFPIMEMEAPEYSPEENCLRLSTIKYVKGIDCPVVILLLTKNYLNYALNGNLDTHSQMNGIYSSITRAMNILSIFISDDNAFLAKNNDSSISKFIKVLKKDGLNYNL